MKSLFTLIALASVASVSVVSADTYYRPYDERYYQDQDCDNERYYQGPSDNADYYQQRRERPQGNYRDDQDYQRNNQMPRNQSHNQNPQYYQQQTDQSRDTNQQRNYGPQRNGHSRTASDQEISRKIQETLSSGWFSKGFQDVSFDVNNGNVNLKGSVDTLDNKNKIEDSVRKIDGVRQINNQIRVVKESSDTHSNSQMRNSEKKHSQDFASNAQDKQLNIKIREKLNSGKSYATLVLKTTNGVVTISGTVDKVEDIQKISDRIKEVEGVRSVNNQLTVKNK